MSAALDPSTPIVTMRDQVRALIDEVAQRHGVPAWEILRRSHRHPVVDARHEAIRIAAQRWPHASAPQLGRMFDRNHTTILYALGRIKARTPRTAK